MTWCHIIKMCPECGDWWADNYPSKTCPKCEVKLEMKYAHKEFLKPMSRRKACKV